MRIRQFLDFTLVGPVFVEKVIPRPCCMEIAGLPGSKNRLDIKLQEMKSPFYIELVREEPGRRHRRDSQSSQRCSQRCTKKKCQRK